LALAQYLERHSRHGLTRQNGLAIDHGSGERRQESTGGRAKANTNDVDIHALAFDNGI